MGSERMSEEQLLREKSLDERVAGALEQVPDVAGLIPEDFAARVAGRVPVKKSVSVTPTHYGRWVMLVCGVVLLVVMVGLASIGMMRSTFGILFEWFLCVQFLVLAFWLGTRRWREG